MNGAVSLIQGLILDSIPTEQRIHAGDDARLLAQRMVREAYTNDQIQLLHHKTALLNP